MSDQQNMEELLVWLILRTARVVADRLREQSSVATSRFTAVHSLAVAYVARHESPTTTDLARHLNVTKQSASQLVTALEQAGILRGVPHPTDGRARLLLITEEGTKLFEEGRRDMQVIEEEWASILGTRQLETVRKALKAYLLVIEKPPTTRT
jgi:DNA-binding MarR family transcriptional regulator